jgi:hypothetical protein
VFFDVLFVGFMPGVVGEFWLALPWVADWVDEVVSVDLLCPGAFPELPGAAVVASELPLAFPLPFPARAELVNAARKIASTIVPMIPAVRLLISFSPRIETVYPTWRYGS